MIPASMIGINDQMPKFIGGTKFGQNFIEPSSLINSEAQYPAKYYDQFQQFDERSNNRIDLMNAAQESQKYPPTQLLPSIHQDIDHLEINS